VRFTRHARNRLRWISRRHPAVSEKSLSEALPRAETVGYDEQGNRRARLAIEATGLIVVIDKDRDTVITMWVE